MRIYVVVTCFDPLRVYVYEDGLVRFATEKYSTADSTLKKRAMHLTNYSVNAKLNADAFNMEEEEDGKGSKWSIKALRSYFKDNNLDFAPIWEQVHDIVVKTLICVEPNVNSLTKSYIPSRNICYEVTTASPLVRQCA
jgi:hypothetical protein